MGWECITEDCNIIEGQHNGEGLAIYSISSDISTLHSKFFEFLLNLSPGLIVFLATISVFMILLYFFINLRERLVNVNQ